MTDPQPQPEYEPDDEITVDLNPVRLLADAEGLLAKYDGLGIEARLQNGPVLLAEVTARAQVAAATASVEAVLRLREDVADALRARLDAAHEAAKLLARGGTRAALDELLAAVGDPRGWRS